MFYVSHLFHSFSFKAVYSGGHFEKFCTMCTEKFEVLECEVVANTLKNFLLRYFVVRTCMCLVIIIAVYLKYL